MCISKPSQIGNSHVNVVEPGTKCRMDGDDKEKKECRKGGMVEAEEAEEELMGREEGKNGGVKGGDRAGGLAIR